MSDRQSVRRFEIAQLVELFRRALLAVGPLAEEAGINWLQEPPYDDWDDAAEGLYDSFVVSALVNSDVAHKLGKFPRYGFDPSGDAAFMALPRLPKAAFLRFAGEDRALDSACYSEVGGGEILREPWEPGEIRLRLPNGDFVATIEVEY